MTRPVASGAIFGLAIAAAPFPLAASIGTAELWPTWGRWSAEASCSGGLETLSRTLAWDGDGSRLDIRVPATIHLEPEAARTITAEGPAAAVGHLTMQDGRLAFDDCRWDGPPARLTIRISGPPIQRIAVHGVSRLEIEGIDQPEIEITVTGSGAVTRKGKAGAATITVTGSGRAAFGELAVQRLKAKGTGSGRAD